MFQQTSMTTPFLDSVKKKKEKSEKLEVSSRATSVADSCHDESDTRLVQLFGLAVPTPGQLLPRLKETVANPLSNYIP